MLNSETRLDKNIRLCCASKLSASVYLALRRILRIVPTMTSLYNSLRCSRILLFSSKFGRLSRSHGLAALDLAHRVWDPAQSAADVVSEAHGRLQECVRVWPHFLLEEWSGAVRPHPQLQSWPHVRHYRGCRTDYKTPHINTVRGTDWLSIYQMSLLTR